MTEGPGEAAEGGVRILEPPAPLAGGCAGTGAAIMVPLKGQGAA